jgi:hypothetical protein
MLPAICRLRYMLKEELFIRTPDGMVPTPRAEQLAAPLRRALSDMQLALCFSKTASVVAMRRVQPAASSARRCAASARSRAVAHRMGSRPAIMAVTVIIFGRTRSTAPAMIAARKGPEPTLTAMRAAGSRRGSRGRTGSSDFEI